MGSTIGECALGTQALLQWDSRTLAKTRVLGHFMGKNSVVWIQEFNGKSLLVELAAHAEQWDRCMTSQEDLRTGGSALLVWREAFVASCTVAIEVLPQGRAQLVRVQRGEE